MSNRILCLLAATAFILSVGCGGGGGGGELNVGSIQGPISVNEGASVQFSINASGDTGITYQWTCNPGSAGSLTNASSATCTFTASAVTADTSATISVTVTSDNDGPEVAQLSITVTDVPVVPDTGWAQTWGGADADRPMTIVTDASNNVYVAGWYNNTTDFDPGAGTNEHTSNGFFDAFLCKYDASGNFAWVATWGGSVDDTARSVAVDGAGNIYVTGYFGDTVDFDPGTGVEEHMSHGSGDSYLSKFDGSGALLWVKTWGGADADGTQGIAIHPASSDVYVVGSFAGTADFDPDSGGYNLTSQGFDDAFLTKFDSAGDFKWARSWGGPDTDIARKLAVDASGNVWTIGEFRGTVDFDPSTGGTDSHTAAGLQSAFLSQIDSSGTYVMANTWGGAGATAYAQGIAINSTGAIFVTGTFTMTVDFHPGLTADDHTSAGSFDAYVSRFDSSGNYNWAVTWGGIDSDHGEFLAIDSSNAIYVTGAFYSESDFDPGSAYQIRTSSGDADVFLNKLDSAGNYIWTRTFGASGWDGGFSIARDSNNNMYITGSFTDTVDFEPGTGVEEHVSAGAYDGFIVKYLPDGSW